MQLEKIAAVIVGNPTSDGIRDFKVRDLTK
jgi:hypothetical protein